MSYNAKNSAVFEQQLRVQELVARTADTHLVVLDGADSLINIGEQILEIVALLHFDNSGPTATLVAAAGLSIENGVLANSVIRVTGLAIDANDVFLVKYITAI